MSARRIGVQIGEGGRHRGGDLGPNRSRSIVIEVDQGATSGRRGVIGWWSKRLESGFAERDPRQRRHTQTAGRVDPTASRALVVVAFAKSRAISSRISRGP